VITRKLMLVLLFVAFFAGAAFAQSADNSARLVVLFPQSLGLSYILGLGNNIVGMPFQRLSLSADDLCDFFKAYSPNIANAVDVGNPGSPNTETILRLNPTLVFSAVHVPASVKLNAFLAEKGVQVLGLKAGFGNVDDWLEVVSSTGAKIDRTAKSEAYVSLFRKNIELVRSRIATVENRPKVLVVNSGDGQPTIWGSRTTFVYDLIVIAGGRVIEDGDNSQNVSANAEVILKFDPDIIITDMPDIVEQWSWWKHLRAVKEKKFFVCPTEDLKMRMTGWNQNLFAPLGLLWLAKTIHPDKFTDVDLTKEHETFCKTVLGKPFAESKSVGRLGH